MKIRVVYDQQGNVITAGYIDDSTPQAYDALAQRFGPEPGQGQSAAELEVPAEYAQRDFVSMMQGLQVDVQAKQPALVPKKG